MLTGLTLSLTIVASLAAGIFFGWAALTSVLLLMSRGVPRKRASVAAVAKITAISKTEPQPATAG